MTQEDIDTLASELHIGTANQQLAENWTQTVPVPPYTLTYSLDDRMGDMHDIHMGDELKIYKLFPEAHLPTYGSEWAACFDLSASLREEDSLAVYGHNNTKTKRPMHELLNGKRGITIYSGERCLVPTGLVFDLDESQSLRIHARSGLAWKNGITIANCEGIIDADYTNQTFVMLYNISSDPFAILDGMRVAQGEVVDQKAQLEFTVVDVEPEPKTDREGGFGSTGVQICTIKTN